VSFWLIAAGLTLLAIAFVALPTLWFRKGVGEQPQAEAVNVALLKEQMDELARQLQAGLVSEADFRERRQELEVRLVADASPSAPRQSGTISEGKYGLTIALVVLALPLAAWILYQRLGSGKAWQLSQRYRAINEQFAAGQENNDTVANFVGDLAQYTRWGASPDWLFLQAQLYMQMGSYQAAADAYGEVARQQPDNAELLARQTQALYLATGRKLTPEVNAMVAQVLAINPHQPTVLGIRGMNAFENADYALAIDSWQQALAGMSPTSPSVAVLEKGIRQAQAAMGASPDADSATAAPGTEPAAAAVGFSQGIKVRVELDQAAEVVSGSIVYVIASAPGGGMPFAVVRLPVEGLPAEVTLDDSTAMAPGNSLSRQSQAKVTARVSRSGNAIAQAGDWQGRSPVLTPATLPPLVAIRIDQKI
jgi:cytochrome c-type biogenesis protein CcmH